MFKRALNKISLVFVGAIAGSFAGLVITLIISAVISLIIGFVFNTIQGIITPADISDEFLHNLGISPFLSGICGLIVGFTTGVGIAFMGISRHDSLIWPVITGTGVLLGGWISMGNWLIQDIVRGDWYLLIFITIFSALATWPVVRLIERMLNKRLHQVGITPRVIVGYIAAFAITALFTAQLLPFITILFRY
jgi:hypothetical protein